MKNYLRIIFAFAFLGLALPCSDALACDLCAIYNTVESQKPRANTFRISLVEQITDYGKLQQDGHYLENTMHQHLESSITQLVGSYDLSNKFSLQASLPYINRRFKRVEGESIGRGTESGIGDMILLARYSLLQFQSDENLFNLQLLSGIKLPTGDSDRLEEELQEEHGVQPTASNGMHDEVITQLRHGDEEHPSAIHGHDLALGSGSWDYPVGISVFAESGKIFTKGSAIYTIRTSGDHEYQYADDFMWDFGPGYFVDLQHDSTVAARVVLSGERKSKDSGRDKEIQSDTGISSLFIGPELNFMVNDVVNGDLGLDLPIDINNSALQAVADYRLRASLTYRF